jgi:SAM-dependent methyltransferase
VEFRVEDAHSLALDDESFHACRAERTLMHVADPARGLSEMIRVAKPGGRIVIYEFDHDTWVINGSDKELTRRFVTVTCESVRSGHIGRQLLGLFRRAGLRDVAVEPHAICYPFELATQIFGGRLRAAEGAHRVDPTDVSRWWADLTKAEGTGSFLCAVTGFLVSGRKL